MKVRQQLTCAIVGWLAGVGIIFVTAFIIFPGVTGEPRGLRTGADWLILGLALLLASVAAAAGGLLGGRIITEGGRSGQFIMAAIVGILLAAPVSCITFWYTGW